CENSNYGMDYW
nr:immunoglobulin heavy chain junction region [Mus musculus]